MGTAANRGQGRLTRRSVLRLAALAVPAVPVTLAGCVTGHDTRPDPLVPLARHAEFDAGAGYELAAPLTGTESEVATAVAEVRSRHEEVLRAEARRANRPEPEELPAPDPVTDLEGLGSRLETAISQIRDLVGEVSRHRAALLGTVAGGCAAALALHEHLGGPLTVEFTVRSLDLELAEASIRALREALAAEHAAIWSYDLIRAFLPGELTDMIDETIAEHRARRDGGRELLRAAGATTDPAEPAYHPPEPVTDEESAAMLAIIAERDTARAWRGLLERTDHGALRQFALQALLSSGTASTRWRSQVGAEPVAVALPGRP
ncbi:ferritin-like domain-containing protein [Haloechinothrix sp. LS1_15]|uniref:ferritin-like domain-containing protein n=1 Tax=Haloechinothrix sp. LS1_15 TaxID=2652248 RepID=UPI00294B6BB1|nr:ferritin-like domain-containing protein [Haloechinothrix sp. LS1_15]